MSMSRRIERDAQRALPLKACTAALLVLAAALAAHPAHATLWRWLDANGHVVYSDIPPTGDVKAERVSGAAPPANPNAVKEMVSQEADLKKRQMQRAEEAGKADKAKADAARREELCNQARGQQKALQMENVKHIRVNERGERVVMDAAMRQQERERIDAFLRKECQPAR